MAQLYFKYGAMNSGKSIEIIKVAHNYQEQNKSVLLFSPAIADRDGAGKVTSRVGLSREAIQIDEKTDLFNIVSEFIIPLSCILVDEVQFVTKEHVLQMTRIVDELNIPVMGFGLKNDFQNNMFEGSKYMMLYADKIEEMKTICWFCEKKATMALRVDKDNKPVREGDQVQIQIGGNDSYYPVCRKHHQNPPL